MISVPRQSGTSASQACVCGCLVRDCRVSVFAEGRLFSLGHCRMQEVAGPQTVHPAEGQGLGMEVHDVIGGEVDDAGYGLPFRQALERFPVRREHLPLRGGELGFGRVPVRGNHDPLPLNADLDLASGSRSTCLSTARSRITPLEVPMRDSLFTSGILKPSRITITL